MAGERILLPGYVEDTEDFPVDRIPYHGRRAGPWLDARAEVLGPVNLHRVADGKRGADGVGAAGAFVPVRAGDELDAPGRIQRGRVALRFEDRPGRVPENHDGAGLGQEVANLLHDGCTRADQVTMPMLEREESLFRKRGRGLRALGIDPGRLAPHPRAFDDVAHHMGGQFAPEQEALPERHHLWFLIRMRERRERFLRHHVAPSSRRTGRLPAGCPK